MRNVNYVEYLEKSLPKNVFVTNYDNNVLDMIVPYKDIHNVVYFLILAFITYTWIIFQMS